MSERSEGEFLEAFDAFARAVRRARGAGAGGDGLTLSQYGLLEPLVERGSARVAELADGAGIAAPTATRIIDALERRGLVERTRDPADRRVVTVTLTADGRAQLEAQQRWMGERRRAFAQSLNPEEQALLPGLLHGLAGLIGELAGGPPP